MASLPPMVMIEWEDSAQAASQWQWLSGVQAPPIARCRSLGFLVKDTKKEKALAISAASAFDGDDIQVSGIITIPARCVLRVERITCLSFRRRPCGRGAASRPKPRAT